MLIRSVFLLLVEKKGKSKPVKEKKGYYTVTVGLTVMAHHCSAGVRVAGTWFGALPVAVLIVGAHAGKTLQGLTWQKTEKKNDASATHTIHGLNVMAHWKKNSLVMLKAFLTWWRCVSPEMQGEFDWMEVTQNHINPHVILILTGCYCFNWWELFMMLVKDFPQTVNERWCCASWLILSDIADNVTVAAFVLEKPIFRPLDSWERERAAAARS